MENEPESNSEKIDRLNVFAQLFAASTWSAVVVTLITLVLVGSASISTIRSNILQGDDVSVSDVIHATPIGGLLNVGVKLGESHIAADLTTFMFWAIIGIFAYLFVIALWNMINSFVELRSDLHNVNAKPHDLLQQTMLRSGTRLLVAVVWMLYAWVFAHLLMPYVVAVAIAGAAQLPQLIGFAYLVLAIIICWLSLHMHVVFCRLMALRVRVFSDSVVD